MMIISNSMLRVNSIVGKNIQNNTHYQGDLGTKNISFKKKYSKNVFKKIISKVKDVFVAPKTDVKPVVNVLEQVVEPIIKEQSVVAKKIEAIADKITMKKGQAYNGNGELYTGEVELLSKNGHKLTTYYSKGGVVGRCFIFKKNGSVMSIEKDYNNKLYKNIRLINTKKKQDGYTVEFNTRAFFVNRKFKSNIEREIKMRDFDNAQAEDLVIGTQELRDGLELKWDGKIYTLSENGKKIRRKFFDKKNNISSITDNLGNKICKDYQGKKYYYSCLIDKDKNQIIHYADGNYSVWCKNGERTSIEDYDRAGNLLERRII